MTTIPTSDLEGQVHLIPTALEYISKSAKESRLGPVFRQVGADKVYLLYNQNPQGHDRNKDSLDAAKRIITELTLADQRRGIESTPINFYDFTDPVISIYNIIYEEQQRGNSVTVHLSGGTKLVAVASVFACALADDPTKVYYVANKYSEQNGKVTNQGPLDEPFQALPPNLVRLVDIPDDPEKKTILSALLSSEGPRRLKSLLEEHGVFDQSEENNSAINSRYHRHKEKLRERALIEIDQQKLVLTQTGRLVAELLQGRREVDKKLAEERFDQLYQQYTETYGADPENRLADDFEIGPDWLAENPPLADIRKVNQEIENLLDPPA